MWYLKIFRVHHDKIQKSIVKIYTVSSMVHKVPIYHLFYNGLMQQQHQPGDIVV